MSLINCIPEQMKGFFCAKISKPHQLQAMDVEVSGFRDVFAAHCLRGKTKFNFVVCLQFIVFNDMWMVVILIQLKNIY